MNYKILPGCFLVQVDGRFSEGVYDGIIIPQIVQGQPMHSGVVLDINLSERDIRKGCTDITGERVLVRAIGGRQVPGEPNRYIYRNLYKRNPEDSGKKLSHWDTSVLVLLDSKADVDTHDDEESRRCRKCGEARSGGANMMLARRQNEDGKFEHYCPRCGTVQR